MDGVKKAMEVRGLSLVQGRERAGGGGGGGASLHRPFFFCFLSLPSLLFCWTPLQRL